MGSAVSAEAITVRSNPEVRAGFLRGELQGPVEEVAADPSETRIALEPASGTIDFEKREIGFRLTRVFYPIDHPAGVTARIGAEWAVIVASGKSHTQGPSYLYTFEIEKRFMSASVDVGDGVEGAGRSLEGTPEVAGPDQHGGSGGDLIRRWPLASTRVASHRIVMAGSPSRW